MGIRVYADAYFKRNLAERYVKEVKLRMAVLLDFKKLSFREWRQYIDHIVANINNNREIKDKSLNLMLTRYFTQPTVVMPQHNVQMFLYNINDKVFIDLKKSERQDVSFKYSLNRGTTIKTFFILYRIYFMFLLIYRKNFKQHHRNNFETQTYNSKKHSVPNVHGVNRRSGRLKIMRKNKMSSLN